MIKETTAPDKITWLKIDEVYPYECNNKVHRQAEISKIVNSIKEFGWTYPILIDENNIVLAGHKRLLAAKQIGLTEVPTIQKDDLSDAQKRAYRIIDNKSSEESEYDPTNLTLELDEIKALDFDITKFINLDFKIDDIVESLDPKSKEEEDNFDESKVPQDTIIKEGDILTLGRHKVLCGSSKEEDNFIKLFQDEKYHLVFTDPPYGVSIGAKNRMLNEIQKSGRVLADIKDDNIPVDDLKELLINVMKNAKKYAADDCTYFVCAPQGGELGMMMLMMMQEAGLRVRHNLIWYKNQPTFSMGILDYDYQHEPILLTWDKKHKRPMLGEHRTSVWKIDRERKCDIHPTMKPVALLVNAMLNNSDEGDLVADFFLGSGTTLIAAEKTNRTCYGIELEPHYCMVIANRYKQYCEENHQECKMLLNGVPYNGD